MMLYEKYRPQTWTDLVGQEKAAKQAQRIIEQANAEAATLEQLAHQEAEAVRSPRARPARAETAKRAGARMVCPHCGDHTWRKVSACEWCAKRLPDAVRTRAQLDRPLTQRQVQERLIARGLATEKASA